MFVRRPSRVRGHHSAAIALLALGLLGPFAPAVPAATFEVDGTGDTGGGACTGAAGDCTLRSAIELSNSTPGVTDLIGFTGFDGQLPGSRITLGSALPSITSPAIINGSSCLPAGAVIGPCVEVAAPSSAVPVLTFDSADNSSINGLSLTGGRTGINVINSSQALTVTNDWIGVKLDGSAGGNSEAGIFIDPDSNGTAIGGTELGRRNVISNNATGVDVLGADQTSIQGNYIGVKPDGVTLAANTSKGIEVTDSTAMPGFTAANSEIGAPISAAGAPTTACDEGCNVIAGSPTGIDLNGNGAIQEEAPATGPTTIRSNYVGVNAGGLVAAPNTTYGIMVGAAKNVTIGADPSQPTFRGTNLIAGGENGIYAEKAEALRVYLNSIGINAVGGPIASPSSYGIFNLALGVTEPAILALNAISMAGGVGIEQRFTGSQIVQNSIVGAQFGILTKVSNGEGNLIAGNGIRGATQNAILIEDDDNEVLGNFIAQSGAAGIRIQTPSNQGVLPSTGNLVGGPFSEENTISESGGPAIQISNLEDSDNEVGPNNGEENAGAFIDLVSANPGTEPNGPNHGIKPPAISSTTTTEVGGTAQPGARILVFRKATAAAGEIESLIGVATADGGGAWKLSYEDQNEEPVTLPAGTNIAALQTSSSGGSSELAFAQAKTPDPEGGGNGGGGGGGGAGGGAGGSGTTDKSPPQTKITKGPKAKSSSRTAKFKFKSTEAGSRFQCKLDRKPFKPCRSPKKYSGLKPGKHVFKVRATDAAGNTDPSPAVKRFKVIG